MESLRRFRWMFALFPDPVNGPLTEVTVPLIVALSWREGEEAPKGVSRCRELCRQSTDLLPDRTATDDVDGGDCPLRGFVHGYEGEVHGEFDAIKLHIAPPIISIIAQIGFTGGRERKAVPVL